MVFPKSVSPPRAALSRIGAAIVVLFAAMVLSSCGGSSGDSNAARIRAINMVSNGGAATIFINSGAANGSQNFNQSSAYLFIDAGNTTMTYVLSDFTTIAPTSITRAIVAGNAYTCVLWGRPDVAANDPRFPRISLFNDTQVTIPSGSALVRLINTAPDGGAASATVGGVSVATSILLGEGAPYTVVPAGNVSAVATLTSGSVAPQNMSLSAGHAYSLFVSEPTVSSSTTTATYGFSLFDDSH